MKLRIARVDDKRRMAGKFAVQSSFLGILWDTIWFDQLKQVLLEEFVLGRVKLVEAVFDDFETAWIYARRHKESNCNKQIIRETWKVW